MIDDHSFFTWSNLTEKNLTFWENFWKCQCELCKVFYITKSQPFYKLLISYLILLEIVIGINKTSYIDVSFMKIIWIVLNVIKREKARNLILILFVVLVSMSLTTIFSRHIFIEVTKIFSCTTMRLFSTSRSIYDLQDGRW